MTEKMCKSCSHQIVCLHASRDIKGCAYYEKYEEPRPHGKWIFKHNSADIWCSNCDENFDEIPQKFLFCPNCGADMRTQNDRSWDTSERGASGSVENSISQEEGEAE